MPNALQIAQGRQVPLTAGLIMALIAETPLLATLDTRTARGTRFMSLALTAHAAANAFVNYGEGFTTTEATLALREFDCSLVGGQIKAERISAQKWDAEHGQVGYTWFDLQTMSKMRSQGIAIEKQIIQGTAFDAKGFPGFKELTPYVTANVLAATASAAASSFAKSVINAGGTTATTAASVYAFIEGELDVQLVLGNDMTGAGELFQLSEMVTSNEAPDANESTKKSLHDLQQFSGHIGLSVAGFNQTPNSVVPTQFSLRRIANLTGDSGKGLTDALMSKLTRSFGPGKRPTKFAMGSRSGEQLAASRQATAVNFVMGQSGDANQATFNTYPPPPENWNGIPIVYADLSIGEADAIEA
jgi:hypothetical protein